ncbi:hypothetical protein DVH05_010744 [Phytophthora capsici]|nr:hypothetical protein DVH05_010744 [Phytophthora capsici]
MGKPNGTQMEWSTVGPKRSTTGEQRVQEGGPAREAGGTTGRVNKDSCEWSQPPADPTKQKKERRIETQEQKGENTQGDEEELNPIGRTITEEIQKITRQSSSGMTKQRGLIFKLAVEKQQKVDKMVHDTCLHINAATYPNESVSGEQVLQDCGLEEMETPGTGNCQYYAVATTVLQRNFDTVDNVTTLENLTGKLKKGIVAAATHCFEEEYNHDHRSNQLKDLARREGEATKTNLPKFTAVQSKTKYQEYLKEMSQTTSKLDARILTRYWGTSESLRMLAKLLERSIFVILARNGMEHASYQIFEPAQVQGQGGKYASAKERIMPKGQPKNWIKALQKACKSHQERGESPIVLKYNGNHYSWLRFKQETDEEDEAMDSDQGDGWEVPGSIELTPNVMASAAEDTCMEESSEAQTESELIEQKGGNRKEELLAFPTEGVKGMAPGKRADLRKADLTKEAAVKQWASEFEVTTAEILRWQQDLREVGSTSTFTPAESSDRSEIESLWTPPSQMENPTDIEESPGEQYTNYHGMGRFYGENTTLGMNRLKEQALRLEWNELKTTWEQATQIPFPVMPVQIAQWKSVVRAAPGELLLLLQQFQSPDYILSTMTEAVLDEWTLSSRRQFLLDGVQKMIDEATTEESKLWLQGWKKEFSDSERIKQDPYNIYARAFWGPLKDKKFGQSEALKLCRETDRQKLARMVLVSHIYRAELQSIAGRTGPLPNTVNEHLDLLFEVLEVNPDLHAAIHRTDTSGCWAVLETKFAKSVVERTMVQGEHHNQQ